MLTSVGGPSAKFYHGRRRKKEEHDRSRTTWPNKPGRGSDTDGWVDVGHGQKNSSGQESTEDLIDELKIAELI